MNNFIFLFMIFLFHNLFCYGAAALHDSCFEGIAVDVMMALDTTRSMKRHKTKIAECIPRLIKEYLKSFTNARFGLVTFTDDDMACLNPSSYGSRVDLMLTNNFTEIHRSISSYNPDLDDNTHHHSENSMGALLTSTLNKSVGWRTDESNYRIVVIVTDASYRLPQDHPPICSPGKLVSNDHTLEWFPSTDQVLMALKATNTVPLFVALNDSAEDNYHKDYRDLLRSWKIRGDAVAVTDPAQLGTIVENAIREIVCSTPTIRMGASLQIGDTVSPIVRSTRNSGIPLKIFLGAGAGLLAIGIIGMLIHVYTSDTSQEGESTNKNQMAEQDTFITPIVIDRIRV